MKVSGEGIKIANRQVFLKSTLYIKRWNVGEAARRSVLERAKHQYVEQALSRINKMKRTPRISSFHCEL